MRCNAMQCPPHHDRGLVTNRGPDQTERARLGIICMRHTIASRCSKLGFCVIPSDKNHLCNGSLQQSKDVILQAKQNSEYLERNALCFYYENYFYQVYCWKHFFCKWSGSPAGWDSLSSCNYDKFFSHWSGCSSGAGIWQCGQQSGIISFVNYMDHADLERIPFQYILGGQKDFIWIIWRKKT